MLALLRFLIQAEIQSQYQNFLGYMRSIRAPPARLWTMGSVYIFGEKTIAISNTIITSIIIITIIIIITSTITCTRITVTSISSIIFLLYCQGHLSSSNVFQYDNSVCSKTSYQHDCIWVWLKMPFIQQAYWVRVRCLRTGARYRYVFGDRVSAVRFARQYARDLIRLSDEDFSPAYHVIWGRLNGQNWKVSYHYYH